MGKCKVREVPVPQRRGRPGVRFPACRASLSANDGLAFDPLGERGPRAGGKTGKGWGEWVESGQGSRSVLAEEFYISGFTWKVLRGCFERSEKLRGCGVSERDREGDRGKEMIFM